MDPKWSEGAPAWALEPKPLPSQLWYPASSFPYSHVLQPLPLLSLSLEKQLQPQKTCLTVDARRSGTRGLFLQPHCPCHE